MAINEFAKKCWRLPVYVEAGGRGGHKGNKRLNKDSVVTLSKSVIPKESVAIAEWCKARGMRVVAITKMRTLRWRRRRHGIFRCVTKWRGI